MVRRTGLRAEGLPANQAPVSTTFLPSRRVAPFWIFSAQAKQTLIPSQPPTEPTQAATVRRNSSAASLFSALTRAYHPNRDIQKFFANPMSASGQRSLRIGPELPRHKNEKAKSRQRLTAAGVLWIFLGAC